MGYEAISWPSTEFVLTQEDSAPCLDATRVVSAITDLPPAVTALHWALRFQQRTDALQSYLSTLMHCTASNFKKAAMHSYVVPHYTQSTLIHSNALLCTALSCFAPLSGGGRPQESRHSVLLCVTTFLTICTIPPTCCYATLPPRIPARNLIIK